MIDNALIVVALWLESCTGLWGWNVQEATHDVEF